MSTLTTLRGGTGDGDRDLVGAFGSHSVSDSGGRCGEEEDDREREALFGRCSDDEDRDLGRGRRRLRRWQHLGNAGNGDMARLTFTFEYTRISSSRRSSIKPPSRCCVSSICMLRALLWLDVLRFST